MGIVSHDDRLARAAPMRAGDAGKRGSARGRHGRHPRHRRRGLPVTHCRAGAFGPARRGRRSRRAGDGPHLRGLYRRASAGWQPVANGAGDAQSGRNHHGQPAAGVAGLARLPRRHDQSHAPVAEPVDGRAAVSDAACRAGVFRAGADAVCPSPPARRAGGAPALVRRRLDPPLPDRAGRDRRRHHHSRDHPCRRSPARR